MDLAAAGLRVPQRFLCKATRAAVVALVPWAVVAVARVPQAQRRTPVMALRPVSPEVASLAVGVAVVAYLAAPVAPLAQVAAGLALLMLRAMRGPLIRAAVLAVRDVIQAAIKRAPRAAQGS